MYNTLQKAYCQKVVHSKSKEDDEPDEDSDVLLHL